MVYLDIPIVYDAEKKELRSGGEPKFSPPGGLGKYFFDMMNKSAALELIAQIDASNGQEESYTDFLAKCIKLALYLKDQGLQPGDIISMCSENNMTNGVIIVASLFAGVVLASTDPLISPNDTKHLLSLVDPKLIFTCKNSFNLIQEATKDANTTIVTLYEHDDTLESVPAILKRYSDDAVKKFEPYYVEDTKTMACILFSSGTTGLPKGICLSHDRLYSDIKPSDMSIGLRGAFFTTLYWLSGVCGCLAIISAQWTRVVFQKYKPERVWEDFDKYNVNFAILSYSNASLSISYLDRPLPNLGIVLFVGGQLPKTYYNEFREKLPKTSLLATYGLTEVGNLTNNSGGSPPESVGQVSAVNRTLRIVDPETEKPLGLNQTGEIRVKGSLHIIGYYKRDDSECWDAEGFFKTGDLGYLNDKYELYMVDRIKEMFKYKSYHVVPARIEKILRDHPEVVQAIVVPIPIENENHALAVVVRIPGSTVTTDELLKFVNDQTDNFHQIRAGVHFIAEEDIPYSLTGKINRRKLVQIYKNKIN